MKQNKIDYKCFLDNLRDLVFIIRIENDFDLVFEEVNKSYSEITGLKRDFILGKSLKEIFPPDTYKRIESIYINLITTGQPIIYEEEWIYYPKEKIIVESSLSPIKDKNNKVKFVIGSSRDITERKKRDKELENLEVSYKDLFNSVTEAIYVLDKEGIYLDVNNGAECMYGYEKSEFIGKTPDFLSAPGKNNLEEVMEFIRKAYEGETQIFQFWGKRKNGQIFPKEVILNRGRYKGKDAIIAAARDISDRYHNEIKMLNFTKELQQINDAKDKFFSIIAHDLRSPFNGLLGFSKVLYEEFDDLSKDELKEFIGYIYDSAKNVYNLVENLLQWSRLQNSNIEFQSVKLDLSEEILKVINLLIATAIEKKITIINLVPQATFINTDQNMISSVLQNIISNAIKFTNPGGKILIKYHRNKNYDRIIVSDNGVGISEKDIPKLFNIEKQHCTTGTANETGTGLGLLICKELLNANNGTIEVKSKLGQGSDFIINIPKADYD